MGAFPIHNISSGKKTNIFVYSYTNTKAGNEENMKMLCAETDKITDNGCDMRNGSSTNRSLRGRDPSLSVPLTLTPKTSHFGSDIFKAS